MESEILDRLTNLEKNVENDIIEKRDGNDVRDKRERLVTCVVSGNSKQYLGKEDTEQQINEMEGNNINRLSNRYESVLSAQMTKSLGKSVINLYSNIACSVPGASNQQDLSNDSECDPILNTAMQRFTCDLYFHFGAFLAPMSVGIITSKHCAKNSGTKLNDRSDNGSCDPAKTRNCNETEKLSEN